jgi:hypothetical protein
MLVYGEGSFELTLRKVIDSRAGELGCYRRRNITLGDRSSRRGFTDKCTPASLRVD